MKSDKDKKKELSKEIRKLKSPTTAISGLSKKKALATPLPLEAPEAPAPIDHLDSLTAGEITNRSRYADSPSVDMKSLLTDEKTDRKKRSKLLPTEDKAHPLYMS